MATVHEGMGITEEEFTAIATHLDDALETFDAPDDVREKVLEENTAWGFIPVGQNPEYAGLYITGAVGAVMSSARIKDRAGERATSVTLA